MTTPLHVEHARLLADLGKNDQAAAEVKKLLDGKADFEVYLSLAEVYDKGKKFDDVGQDAGRGREARGPHAKKKSGCGSCAARCMSG